MKEKVVNEKEILKARLCARGFEEEQNFRTDSPTCSRERLRLFCCISSNQWALNSLDVKTAFLQGKTLKELKNCICTTSERSQHQQNLEIMKLYLWSCRYQPMLVFEI